MTNWDKQAVIRKVIRIIEEHSDKVTYSSTTQPSYVASSAKKHFEDAADEVKQYLKRHLPDE